MPPPITAKSYTISTSSHADHVSLSRHLSGAYEGGYVFARVFWEIYDTSPEFYPEDFLHHTYPNAQDSNEAVDEQVEPTVFELYAYEYAIESYRDHERYGIPYPGGSKDQPYVWKLALDCVNDAINQARAQAHAEARENRKE